ncbi:ribulose-phosphate 3-epimerase [Clostridia bacterium]|nr:ribulose-phosphate 3-epimerase [Clostridia bacterium]
MIVPSILSADLYDLRTQLDALKAVGMEVVHVDVMDGQFVPNLSFGLPMVHALRGHGFKLDVHLMIEKPERYVEEFIEAGADFLTVHYEAVPRGALAGVLREIRAHGAKAGLSLRPDTPVASVSEFLELCDLLLVMTVPPGFGAQHFDPNGTSRISEARKLIDELQPECILEVDGGIDCGTIGAAYAAGARLFVAGSAVFRDKALSPANAFVGLAEQAPQV